jgi:hypothetical protein
VAGRSLYGHNVTALEREIVDILIVRTACILKTNLKNISRDIIWILLQPRCLVELVATLYGCNA